MKKLLIILPFLSYNLYAQETINSNNTNTNTTNQTINQSDIYDYSGQSSIDSSTHLDQSIANDYSTGSFRNNIDQNNSNNNIQQNRTFQDITNNNTRIQQGVIENSLNNNNNGNTVGTNAQGEIQQDQLQDQNQTQGFVSQVNVSPNYSQTVKQVRQNPMAWSPNIAMGFSPENCNNSVSLGGSGMGVAAGSLGFPIKDDACNRRRDTILWMNVNQPIVACYRMTDNDANADALRRAGLSCNDMVVPVPVVYTPSSIASDTAIKMDNLKIDNEIYNEVFNSYMNK